MTVVSCHDTVHTRSLDDDNTDIPAIMVLSGVDDDMDDTVMPRIQTTTYAP